MIGSSPKEALQIAFQKSRLVASVQADEDTPLDDPEVLLRSAQASLENGAAALRVQGVNNINHIKERTGALVIGLIKRKYRDCDIYITPTEREVDELLKTQCEVIALDGTLRERPTSLVQLVRKIHYAGKLVMFDCDTIESIDAAIQAGGDLIGTTLSGYTESSAKQNGPDFQLLREAAKLGFGQDPTKRPILIAEGRFQERWQVDAALRIGAFAVTVGGAINDPIKNTKRLMPNPSATTLDKIAVIDVGGTWLRYSRCSPTGLLGGPFTTAERLQMPPTREPRIKWLTEQIERNKPERIGISSAGVVWNNVVTLSKKFIPENQGTDYNILREHLSGDDSIGVIALGDGHASAWAHACHPDFAGKDIVVMAIGTGLGYGHVREGKIVMGSHGEYSRLNDLPGPGNKTFEELLGGAGLTPNPTDQQKEMANQAVEHAIRMISTLLFPDVIVVCGTVGMQPWLNLELPEKEGWPNVPVVRSPLGADAGLYGAAALALYPPEL